MKKLTMHELGRMSRQEFAAKQKMPVVLVLDNLRSAFNVGSIFRTADAFAIQEIICCGITARPDHREVMKTALGAEQTVPWRYAPDTLTVLAALKSDRYRLYALEQTDDSLALQDFHPGPAPWAPMAFVFGNEVHGVSEACLPVLHACLEIPQFGTKHSFNVSVTAGILLWHLFIQKNKAS